MDIQGYNMPEDLYYEENHFWVKEEGDLLVMGMDDFAQKMAGEIVYVQLPEEGKEPYRGQEVRQDRVRQVAGERFMPRSNGELGRCQRGPGDQPRADQSGLLRKGMDVQDQAAGQGGAISKLIHGPEAIEKWILADIEKYKK